MLALALFIAVEICINFDGVNSSSALRAEMPYRFHDRFYLLGALYLCIALFSFMGSYFEANILMSLSSLLCIFAITACVLLCGLNELTSREL